VHYDADGRPETVDLGGQIQTVSTRNDQIAQLSRSLDPATWKDPDRFLATHLSPAEFQALDGLRGPDGKLPPNVVETQVADLLERAFDAETRGPVSPGASPLENALRGIPTRYYYDPTDAQAVLVHDVRHLLGSGDINQPFQTILGADCGQKTLAGTDRYPGSVGGFISQASDAAQLRTVDENILGLRLDYRLEDGSIPFKVGAVDEVYAIRFQAKTADQIGIPDASNRARVEEIQRNRDTERARAADGAQTRADREWEHRDTMQYREDMNTEAGAQILADSDVWPNTGHGLTSSRVENVPLVPELEIDGGIRLFDGAEMWRIDRNGNEVLVGIYTNKKWVNL